MTRILGLPEAPVYPTCGWNERFFAWENAVRGQDLACVAGAKRRRRGGGRKARKSEKTLSTQSPSFFPSSLSPTPFDVCYARRLTGFRYAIQFEAHDNGGVACLGGGGGGGVPPRNFWWGTDKKILFLHPFSDLLQRQKLRHHLTLESQQEDFLKSISNSHIALPMLLIWNWNDTTLMHSCSSI